MQAKHEGITFNCESGDYKTISKQSLKFHNDVKHLGITYNCESCDYETSRKQNLKPHTQPPREEDLVM